MDLVLRDEDLHIRVRVAFDAYRSFGYFAGKLYALAVNYAFVPYWRLRSLFLNWVPSKGLTTI